MGRNVPAVMWDVNEMGALEEGSKVILSWTDALKKEPLSLALVLMNLALLFFFWMILNAVAAQREREVNLLYEDKKEVRELISRCIVPEKPPQQRSELAKPLDEVIPLPKPKPLD
jgi:hypothetical protein